MIQLHRLEGFYWVARAGGYARAARAFPYPITQPAVHQQVKKLEQELGLDLFERVAKDRVQLTPAGRKLYHFVAPFFAELPAVVRAVQSGDAGGRLEIGAAPMLLRHLLPAWLKRLHKQDPDVAIELHECLNPDVQGLRGGQLDLVIDHLPEVPDDVATLHVATLQGFLVLPSSHRLARRKRIDLPALSGETFLAYNARLYAHELQMQALRMHDTTPGRIVAAGSAETILGFVEAGLGFSLVPSLDPEGPQVRGITARPLTSPKVQFEVVAAWRKNAPENAALDAFLETAPKP